jgi:hypothetical protein
VSHRRGRGEGYLSQNGEYAIAFVPLLPLTCKKERGGEDDERVEYRYVNSVPTFHFDAAQDPDPDPDLDPDLDMGLSLCSVIFRNIFIFVSEPFAVKKLLGKGLYMCMYRYLYTTRIICGYCSSYVSLMKQFFNIRQQRKWGGGGYTVIDWLTYEDKRVLIFLSSYTQNTGDIFRCIDLFHRRLYGCFGHRSANH